MFKVNNKINKITSFEQDSEGSKLTAVDWFYSLLTLLLTSNRHSPTQTHPNNLKTKILRALL